MIVFYGPGAVPLQLLLQGSRQTFETVVSSYPAPEPFECFFIARSPTMSEQKLRIAHLHLQQADLYRTREVPDLKLSIEQFTKAIDIYKELAQEEPGFWVMVADTIESVGATYKAAGESDKALEAFEEATKLRLTLLKSEGT